MMTSIICETSHKCRDFHRMQMERFDFASKKNQQKKSVELIAVAVRNTSASSEGMYCKVLYGDRQRKTKILAKGEVPEWKENLSLSTYSAGNLTIECWKKKRLGTLKKLLGKLTISRAELNQCPNGTVKGWFSLAGKKDSSQSTGRIYVNLIIPERYNTSDGNTAIVPSTIVQNVNKPTQPKVQNTSFGVVDRLFELRPELKNAVVEEGSVPNEFCQKMTDIEKIITLADNHLQTLEHNLAMLNRRGTNLFLKQETERMIQELDQTLAIGVKRLRKLGTDLNAVDDKDLQQKMECFNKILSKVMSRMDEYNRLRQEFNKRESVLVGL